MKSIEVMTVAIAVGMTIIPSMKARFRKEFYRATKHSVLALLVVLTGILILEFSRNATIQALMVALMGIASAVEFCIAGTNAIETIGDKLAIHSKSGKLFRENKIRFSDWLPEVYRVLKPSTHAYIMVNGRNLRDLQNEAEKVGFKFHNILVWDKGNATPNRWYMQAVEFILMLRKGKAKNINDMGEKNILRIPNMKNKLHPTEKPVELMEVLVRNSTRPGETVLDPFMGAGATGVACVNSGREFIGIELDEKYFEIAEGRILMK